MAASKSRISLRCSDTRGQVAASIFPRINGNVNIENSLKIRKNENRKNTENRTENGRLKRNENRYEFEKLENESHKNTNRKHRGLYLHQGQERDQSDLIRNMIPNDIY